jgi:DNA polymerase III subunit delta
MVALKSTQIDGFLHKPDPVFRCALIYGPDIGLVHERARHLAHAAVDDAHDPFAFVRLDGDALASDPLRLADEAYTRAMFGGRRCIWISAGSRSIAPSVGAVLDGPEPEARIIIEAGDLKKNAPLRTLIEKSPKGVAIPCYTDNEAGLARLIDSHLGALGKKISSEARGALVMSLGADRQATRAELDKLALYALADDTITLDHVEEVLTETADLALDDAVDAAFGGNAQGCERALHALRSSGVAVAASLSAALRHALQLYPLLVRVEAGERAGQVVDNGWRGLHFKRKALVEKALSQWTVPRLDAAIGRLGGAVASSRKAGVFGDTIAHRTLLAIAAEASRR